VIEGKVIYLDKPKSVGAKTTMGGAFQMKQIQGSLPDGNVVKWNNPIQTAWELTDFSYRPLNPKGIEHLLFAPEAWSLIAFSFEKAHYIIPANIKQCIIKMTELGKILYNLGEANPLIMLPQEAYIWYGIPMPKNCEICGRKFGIVYKRHFMKDGKALCYDCLEKRKNNQTIKPE
jgi:hypothetical protein